MSVAYTSGCTERVVTQDGSGLWLLDGGVLQRSDWPSAVEQWSDLINAAAVKYSLAPAFIAGVMATESRGDPRAGSGAGAVGLMQLMPQFYGGNANGELYDPATNIDKGARTLQTNLAKYGGNPIKALATYNAGHVECTGQGVFGVKENTGYVQKCLAFANTAVGRGFSPVPGAGGGGGVVGGGSVGSESLALFLAFAVGAALFYFADRQWSLSMRLVGLP